MEYKEDRIKKEKKREDLRSEEKKITGKSKI